MQTTLIVDGATGETVTRDATPKEVALYAETENQRSTRLKDECSANRRNAYMAEADPLFFKWQRGEATQDDWLTAVANIRTRYPMPDA